MKEFPKRKQIRLPEFDYSSGAYFVTICTQDRRCILSDVAVGEGLAPPAVRLSAIGQCVEEEIHAVTKRYESVRINNYVIMPNHVHLIVSICEQTGGASPSPTLADIVRVIKSVSAHRCSELKWQRSYYEHIIRSERDYLEIWTYIDGNPAKWADDKYYIET
ncbi:MAG: transposase [Oscillospiraceae bacterium]|nr:transposase [Oscillospiraceae bacterium]